MILNAHNVLGLSPIHPVRSPVSPRRPRCRARGPRQHADVFQRSLSDLPQAASPSPLQPFSIRGVVSKLRLQQSVLSGKLPDLPPGPVLRGHVAGGLRDGRHLRVRADVLAEVESHTAVFEEEVAIARRVGATEVGREPSGTPQDASAEFGTGLAQKCHTTEDAEWESSEIVED